MEPSVDPILLPEHKIVSTTKHAHRIRAISITVFAIILLATIATYGYFFIYINPTSIFYRAIARIPQIQSSQFEGELHAEYEKSTDESFLQIPISFSTSFAGAFTQNKNTPIQYETALTLNAGAVKLSDLEIKKMDSDVYILIKNLSDVGLIDNSKVINQWIQFNLNDIPSLYPTVRAFSFLSPHSLISSDMIFALRNTPPATITEVFPDEEIDGTISYHYTYHIDHTNLISFVKTFEETQINTGDKVSTALSDNLASIEFDDGDVWISKDKTIITQLIMNFTRHGEDVDSPVLHVGLDVHLTNIDQENRIVEPENYKTIEEVFTDIVSTIKIPSGISN